jgi:hypothetical protein
MATPALAHRNAALPHRNAALPHRNAALPHRNAALPHRNAGLAAPATGRNRGHADRCRLELNRPGSRALVGAVGHPACSQWITSSEA